MIVVGIIIAAIAAAAAVHIVVLLIAIDLVVIQIVLIVAAFVLVAVIISAFVVVALLFLIVRFCIRRCGCPAMRGCPGAICAVICRGAVDEAAVRKQLRYQVSPACEGGVANHRRLKNIWRHSPNCRQQRQVQRRLQRRWRAIRCEHAEENAEGQPQ